MIRTGAICLLSFILLASACQPISSEDAAENATSDAGVRTVNEADDRTSRIEALKERYPRIPAGSIRVPPADQLAQPNFDVGGHCLGEERAGRGSFEQCIEVIGRELLALGGPH
jgi:hypothetical protein